MLSDRSYMRGTRPAYSGRMLTWLLCAIAGGFVVQVAAERIGYPLERIAALSPAGIRAGMVWTLVSYALLHDGFWHLLGNGLALYFLGREILPWMGGRNFAALTLGAALAAGLSWLATRGFRGDLQLVGASGIALSYLIVFACFSPDREITLVLFFLLPVRLRPKFMAWLAVALSVLGLVLLELPGTAPWDVACSAHLGGMAAGWLYYRYFHASRGWDRAPSMSVELPRWLQRSRAGHPPPTFTVNVTPPPENLRGEVDRILDKINSHGFGALTPGERRTLDQAKDLLSRR